MDLRLTIFKDETMAEVERVAVADKLQIPYRVALYIIQSLDTVNLDDANELVKFISGNIDKLDKIVKATFKVSDAELECVDGAELLSILKELYNWAIEKANSLGSDSKNVKAPVEKN